MRMYIFLLLVFVAETLARAKYKKDIDDNASFKDSVSVSMGPDRLSGEFEKNFNMKPLKPLTNILDIFGLGNESKKSEKIGFDISGGGGIGVKPKFSIDKNGIDIGMSLNGAGGLDFGTSDDVKNRQKEKHPNKHNEFETNHKWWKASNNNHEISGAISNNKDGKKHNNGQSESHEDRNYWDERGIVVVPFFDESGDASGNDDKTHSIKRNEMNENADVAIGGIIFLPWGESDDTSSNGKHESESESHKYQNNYDGKKGVTGSTHVGGGKVIISHGNSGQSSSNDKGHNGKHQNNYDEKKEGSGIHVEGGKKINISHNNGGQSSSNDKKQNNHDDKKEGTGIHVGGGGKIIISHGNSEQTSEQHNGKHQNNHDGKKEGTIHVGGGGKVIISHGNNGQSSSNNKEHDGKYQNNHNEKKESTDIHAAGGGGKVIISHGNSGQTSEQHGGKHQSNHGEEKEGSIHIGGGGKVIITHGNNGQSSSNDKEYNGKHQNNQDGKKEGTDIHAAGGGGKVIISHGNSGQTSEQHNGKHQNNHDGKKEGSIHVGGGGKVIISHGQSNGNDRGYNGKDNQSSHIKKGGGVVISHEGHYSGHNVSKGHQESSTKNGTKKDRKDGELKGGNNHIGGIINTTLSHNYNGKSSGDSKKHNSGGSGGIISHGIGGSTTHGNNNSVKSINGTINENHGSRSGNSTGHGSLISTDGKGSGKHDKHDERSNNCNRFLENKNAKNEKCGSDIKNTLKSFQTMSHYVGDIFYSLLEMKEADLRNTLCHILPRNSKLSCQLGCNILRARSVYKVA